MPEEDIDGKQPEDTIQSALAKATDQIRRRADDFWSYYTNNMAVAFSSWDMWIVFGEIVGNEGDKAVIEEVVKVTMTREMAKVFSHVLATNIAAYEKMHGEIKIPNIKVQLAPPTEQD